MISLHELQRPNPTAYTGWARSGGSKVQHYFRNAEPNIELLRRWYGDNAKHWINFQTRWVMIIPTTPICSTKLTKAWLTTMHRVARRQPYPHCVNCEKKLAR